MALLGPLALVRESLSRVLEGSGVQVVAQTGDAQEFAQKVGELRPEVALLDVGSPVEPQLELLERLRHTHPDVCLLAISDEAGNGLVDRCFQAGAHGCLDTRYTTIAALVDAVQSVARGASIYPAVSFETVLSQRHEPEPRTRLLGQLSVREREVLAYIAAGADNLKIASHLGISERTVKAHVSSLYRKLGQENRTQIALFARELGIRPPPGV